VSESAESVNYFAENVSRMAAMHGLSLERLARLLGLSPQTISMWRAGKRTASGGALMAVGTFFEIDPVALTRHSFDQVLPLMADPDRYRRIEARITGANLPQWHGAGVDQPAPADDRDAEARSG
jgi:transcriptional regulator with XRE-family HTH domain